LAHVVYDQATGGAADTQEEAKTSKSILSKG
jgi:hypothetical protein